MTQILVLLLELLVVFSRQLPEHLGFGKVLQLLIGVDQVGEPISDRVPVDRQELTFLEFLVWFNRRLEVAVTHGEEEADQHSPCEFSLPARISVEAQDGQACARLRVAGVIKDSEAARNPLGFQFPTPVAIAVEACPLSRAALRPFVGHQHGLAL